MVECPIPGHITGIYVFAVLNLLAMLCVSGVDSKIYVFDTDSNMTADSFDDFAAAFGPDLPDNGLRGRIIYADPPDACSPVQPPPPTKDEFGYILLIARGGKDCHFTQKVLNAQQQNYTAAIVHNYPGNNDLERMQGGNNASLVEIPSVFVGYSTGATLRQEYNYHHTEYIVKIDPDDFIDYKMFVWPFITVVAVCFVMVIIFMLVRYLRDHASRRQNRLSTKHLKKIPVRKFKKGDYYDTCAICLDEYEEGEKLRVLPCDHVYHTKCIDPWLTKNKKTCPVCKQRVIPGRDADSDSDSDSDNGGGATGSETTPLLRGANSNSATTTRSAMGRTQIPPPQAASTSSSGSPTPCVHHPPYGRHNPPMLRSGSVGSSSSINSDTREKEAGVEKEQRDHASRILREGNTRRLAQARMATNASAAEKGEDRVKRGRREVVVEDEEEQQLLGATAAVVTETRREKRKKRDKKRKAEAKREEEEEDVGAAAAAVAASTSSQALHQDEEPEEQEEEKRKDGKNDERHKKKKKESRSSRKSKVEKEEEEEEEFASACSSLRDPAAMPGQKVGDEGEGQDDAKHEAYINPSYSESQEVVVPRRSRRNELNELV